MRKVAFAEANAQLSALLDAIEADEEVVITRHGQPVARMVREHHPSAGTPDWVSQLRALHGNQPGPPGLLREHLPAGLAVSQRQRLPGGGGIVHARRPLHPPIHPPTVTLFAMQDGGSVFDVA